MFSIIEMGNVSSYNDVILSTILVLIYLIPYQFIKTSKFAKLWYGLIENIASQNCLEKQIVCIFVWNSSKSWRNETFSFWRILWL